jgi:DNA-binding MarR family transcriptional regulator
MTPDRSDIERLAAALHAVTSGIERARRKIPEAATLSVLQVLAWARRTDPAMTVRPSDLAGALDVHRSAITRHLQNLEQAGQVSLTVDPADRRSWIVRLTDAGLAEADRLMSVGLDRYAAFVADWDADDVRTLTELLLRFEASRAKAGKLDTAATVARRPARRPSATTSRPSELGRPS